MQALLAELGEPILSSTLILPGAAEPLNDAETIRDGARARRSISSSTPARARRQPTTVVDLAVEPP